jgi:uncharacterized protein (DUF433 family)
MSTLTYPHIELDREGVPRILGTSTKVVEVVLDRLAYNWGADEIQRQHPHLTLAQIYGALAYYHDHQSELDRDIEARLRGVGDIQAAISNSLVRAKLQAARRTV